MSVSPVWIYKSVFKYCISRIGGCICCFSNLSITSCEFFHNRAVDGGSIFHTFDFGSIEMTSFRKSASLSRGAALFCKNGINSSILCTNASSCASYSDGSAYHIQKYTGFIQNCIFIRCKSSISNGGVCLASVNLCQIKDSAFISMMCEPSFASSIYSSDRYSLIIIDHCSFSYCSSTKHFSISLITSNSIILAKNIFSNAPGTELSFITHEKSNSFSQTLPTPNAPNPPRPTDYTFLINEIKLLVTVVMKTIIITSASSLSLLFLYHKYLKKKKRKMYD